VIAATFHKFVSEVRRNQQLDAPDADTLRRADPRQQILFLRSFLDEKKALKKYRRAYTTEEELVAKVMQQYGPFVAIGNPADQLPQLGAARVVVPNASWQEYVRSELRRSSFVLVRLGSSPGILWELQLALTELPRTRILILNALDRQTWSVARAMIEREFGIQLGCFSRRPSLFYFTDDGKAVRVQIRKWNIRGRWKQSYIEVGMRIAMIPFVRRLGMPTSIPPLNRGKIVWACVMALIMFTVCRPRHLNRSGI
jgi:hypothetical protein